MTEFDGSMPEEYIKQSEQFAHNMLLQLHNVSSTLTKGRCRVCGSSLSRSLNKSHGSS